MPESTDNAPESRRDALASALDEASAPTVTPEAESGSADTAAAAPPAAEVAQTAGAPDDVSRGTVAERARDKEGKFAKDRGGKPNGATPPKTEAKTTVPAVETAAQKKARDYPGTWKKDHEPAYRKLEANPEFSAILDEIERREGDIKKGFESAHEFRADAERFRKAVQPFAATLQSLGLPPDRAVQSLLAADHALRYSTPQTKVQHALRMLQGYGIDPAQLVAAMQPQGEVDPRLSELQQQLTQTQQTTHTLLSTFEQQMKQQADASVEEFGKNKPHFQEVRGEMGRLLRAGICQTLPDAYDRAIYGTPAIREKVLAEQQAKAEAERKQKAQAEAAAAKTAAVQVKGGPSGNAQSSSLKAKDRRSMLAEVAGRLS